MRLSLVLLLLIGCTAEPQDTDTDTHSSVTRDADGDGFTVEDGDCDDAQATVHPGAEELCDGLHNDCDGWIGGEPALRAAETDDDDDTFVDCELDVDIAAWGHAESPAVTGGGDCRDDLPAVHPGATEICDPDDLDEDCNGKADDEEDTAPANATSWWHDGDGDGHGDVNASTATKACDQPEHTAPDKRDCDDENDAVYPGAPQICDGENNDCDDGHPVLPDDEIDSDDDGYVECVLDVAVDAWGTTEDPVVVGGGDCEPSDGTVHPNGPDRCDGKNNDCLATDYPAVPAVEIDSDDDGYVECELDVTVDAWANIEVPAVAGGGDCQPDNGDVSPGETEVCDPDNVDEDCNGKADDDEATPPANATSWWHDGDGDGHGDVNAFTATTACDQPANTAPDKRDCDDGDATIHPGAPQLCDGKNNDCDAESYPAVPALEVDDDNDGYVECALDVSLDDWANAEDPAVVGGDDCDDRAGGTGSERRFPGNPEVCDGLDNDCDERPEPSPQYVLPSSQKPTTIQAAIDAASPGEAICVEPDADPDTEGIQPWLVNLDLGNDSVTVFGLEGAEAPVVLRPADPQQSVARFRNDDGADIVFRGFTIEPAESTVDEVPSRGGALQVDDASPLLYRLHVTGMTAEQGGGLWVRQGAPVIRNVVFEANTAEQGGGAYLEEAEGGLFENVVFHGNLALYDVGGGSDPEAGLGAGAWIGQQGQVEAVNVVFSANVAEETGRGDGAVYIHEDGGALFSERVAFSRNEPEHEPRDGEFHAETGYVETGFQLRPDSPLIDAGTERLLDPDCSISDIGAYGGPGADFAYYEGRADDYDLDECEQ